MINKLVEKIKKTNAPIVVGLDPMMKYIPEHIQKQAFDAYGETLKGAGEALWQYNKGIVDEYRRPKLAYETVKESYRSFGNYFQEK